MRPFALTRRRRYVSGLVLASVCLFGYAFVDAAEPKPRLVVMTDIGGDPDDEQSIVRFLLYACDFEVEGLCTGFGHGHYQVTHPELIRKAVDAYGQVLPQLRRHREDFPSHEKLVGLIKDGSNGDPHSVGPGRDSEASDWIIHVLDRDDPRPVWVSIWGGPRELAQAIWKVQTTRSAEELAAFKRKIRVHSIADQDRTAGWVKENHPDVFWIYSKDLFRGIWKEGDQAIVSPAWLERNVRTGHGPLGPVYPPKAAGKEGVKEGDTPSFFYVLPNGLSDPEHPEWGNWGGRFQPSGRGREYLPVADLRDGIPDLLYTIHRWRKAYQNDFEARMDWCVCGPKEANHAPTVVCNGDTSRQVLQQKVKPGDTVRLSATGSTDPDGDRLRYRWWIYNEVGTCPGEVSIAGADTTDATISVPPQAAGEIHVILEVTDEGTPPLTAYRRVILTAPPIEFRAAPDGPWRFLRGVNVNGRPVEIDGHRWDGGEAAGFACNGKALLTPHVEPRPAADAATSAMLTSFRYDRNLQVHFEDLPTGTYAVFAYIFEDNNSESLTFAVEGRVVQHSYASGDAGHWQRLGPWITRVEDGSLDLASQGGAANLSGIELWTMAETDATAK